MTVPNSQWFTGFGQKPEQTFNTSKPQSPPLSVFAESLGGSTLNTSTSDLTERWWVTYQVGQNVVVAGQMGAVYSNELVIFQEPEQIIDISLAFDQLNRPVIAYKLLDSQVKLYWYDSVLGDQTVSDITVGSDPFVLFDYPKRPFEQFADVLLFYVKNNRVYWREQRDRYQTEREVANVSTNKLVDVYVTTDGRVQLMFLPI